MSNDRDLGPAPGENKEVDLPEGDMGDFDDFMEDYIQARNRENRGVETQESQDKGTEEQQTKGGTEETQVEEEPKNEDAVTEHIPELKEGEKEEEELEEKEEEPTSAAPEKKAGEEEEPPATETHKEEPPSAEPSEVSELRKLIEAQGDQIRDLMNENARLSRTGAREEQRSEGTQESTDQKPTAREQQIPKVKFDDLMTQEEAEALEEKPREILNSVFGRFAEAILDYASRSIPEVAGQTIRAELEWQRAGEKFFEDNQDLRKYADFCGVIADTVGAENPGAGPAEIFEKTAERARERLGLAPVEKGGGEETPKGEEAPSASNTQPSTPALPTKGAGRRQRTRPPPKVSDLQSEVDELIEPLDL